MKSSSVNAPFLCHFRLGNFAFGQPAYIQLSDNPPLDTTMSGNDTNLSAYQKKSNITQGFQIYIHIVSLDENHAEVGILCQIFILLKSVHFKKTVARISFLSKLWYFFVLICIESTTILKETRFAQLSSKNEWTLNIPYFQKSCN